MHTERLLLAAPAHIDPSAVMTAAWPPGARVGGMEEASVDQKESYVSAEEAMGVGVRISVVGMGTAGDGGRR